MDEMKKTVQELIKAEEQRALTNYCKASELPAEFTQVDFFEKCVAYGRIMALRDLQTALKDYL